MAPWVKRVFIHILPRLLVMRRPQYKFETNRLVSCVVSYRQTRCLKPKEFDRNRSNEEIREKATRITVGKLRRAELTCYTCLNTRVYPLDGAGALRGIKIPNRLRWQVHFRQSANEDRQGEGEDLLLSLPAVYPGGQRGASHI